MIGLVWSHYCTLNEDGKAVGPRPLEGHSEGDREVVHGCASRTRGYGSWSPFDLHQRATSRAWSRGYRGQRQEAADDAGRQQVAEASATSGYWVGCPLYKSLTTPNHILYCKGPLIEVSVLDRN
jgi:hypothetical protein